MEYLTNTLKQDNLPTDERKKLVKQKKELETNRKKIENGVLRPLKYSKAAIKIQPLPLEEVLPSSERHDLFVKEFDQFKDDQFDDILIVNEKPPINWWAFSIIAGAAILQIVGGASAAIFSLGVGAGVGFALLQVGFLDIIMIIHNLLKV